MSPVFDLGLFQSNTQYAASTQTTRATHTSNRPLNRTLNRTFSQLANRRKDEGTWEKVREVRRRKRGGLGRNARGVQEGIQEGIQHKEEQGEGKLQDKLQDKLDKVGVNTEFILDLKSSCYADPTIEEILRIEATRRRRNLSEGEIEIETRFKRGGGNKMGLKREEEIELGRIVQEGVKIMNLKSNLKGSTPASPTLSASTGLPKSTIRRKILRYRKAKNLLVTSNLPLVHSVVRNMYKYTEGRTYEDMVQEGSQGLLRAAELYDPEKGLRFSTYAVVWIKGVLGNSIASGTGVKVPLRERTKINKIRKFVEGYEGEVGRKPTVEEIGDGTGMRVEEVEDVQRRVREAGKLLSIDYVHDYGSGGFQGAMLDKCLWDDVSMFDRISMQADVVAMLVSQLTERERRLIILRYGLDGGGERSLAEVGKEMRLSKERVRVINKEAV
eukprot:CAMPEP_0118656710 /NCGR_PEP_ID=MMETSP0785-20121206/13628_1 /TAXON_ID=91992 /ORGANISM="Bolidomonas pacifica, Strain CCMP 1866" /LENGTH=441 /DNA_ID=CAMNT_0006549575 /DNA_START=172 /DNA_END=1494 /DNA_ORIENTATION=+